MRKYELRLRSDNGKKNVVGKQVREKRIAVGMSPDDLAELIKTQTQTGWDVGAQEIYRLERGARAVTDIEVLALAQALECDPCDLLRGLREENRPEDEGE